MKRAIRCGIRGKVLNQAQWPIKAPATFHTVSARVGRHVGLGFLMRYILFVDPVTILLAPLCRQMSSVP